MNKLTYKVIDHAGSGHWMVRENDVYTGITVKKINGNWYGYVGVNRTTPQGTGYSKRQWAAQEAIKVRDEQNQSNYVFCDTEEKTLTAAYLSQRLVETRNALVESLKGKGIDTVFVSHPRFNETQHQLAGVLNFLVDELAKLGCSRSDLSRRYGWTYINERVK